MLGYQYSAEKPNNVKVVRLLSIASLVLSILLDTLVIELGKLFAVPSVIQLFLIWHP